MNMFKDAKFGDKFVTRDGRIIRFIHDNFMDCKASVLVFDETSGYTNRYSNNGVRENKFDLCAHEDDIVSHYQEPINEKEFEELVHNYTPLDEGDMDIFTHEQSVNITKWIDEAFKAGYRKAMEE